ANFAERKFAALVYYAHASATDGAGRSNGNGLSAFDQIPNEVPRVLLADEESPEEILEAFRGHIQGYVPTTLPIAQVAEAIRLVAVGGTFVPPSILSLCRQSASIKEPMYNGSTLSIAFSPRQKEILHRLWRGCSNKMIAYELNMCESTVKVHIRQ